MTNSTKYTLRLSNEELKDIMISEVLDVANDRNINIKKEIKFLRFNRVGLGSRMPKVYLPLEAVIKVVNGVCATVSDYDAIAFINNEEINMTDIHRRNMYRAFGKEYLDDLKAELERPVLDQLQAIQKEMADIQADVILPEEL